MSSTQIQLDRDSEVSVQTQSITARNSVRNGTRRKLKRNNACLSYAVRRRALVTIHNVCMNRFSQHNSPLKQEEVDIIVALCEKVPQNAGGITAADLIG